MSDVILDASAALAVLLRERGGETVLDLIRTADNVFISAVNLTEVFTRLTDLGVEAAVTRVSALGPQLNIVPFTEDHALAAARLRPLTRHLGLSLGDRACLALAQERQLAAVTTDATWSRLDLAGLTVTLAR